eukprot:3689200-Amphidinium_carterae.1
MSRNTRQYDKTLLSAPDLSRCPNQKKQRIGQRSVGRGAPEQRLHLSDALRLARSQSVLHFCRQEQGGDRCSYESRCPSPKTGHKR